MPAPNETYYDILGVPRNAKNTDIDRAYQKLVRANQREDVPPDARRDLKVREAYETLFDSDRRDAYDRSLVVTKAKGGGKIIGAAIAGTLVVTVGVVAWLNRGAGAPAAKDRPVTDIHADAARAMGRVQSIDISGKSTATGFAFAIAENVMATTCAGLAPGAQILVSLESRNAPARLTDQDPLSGLCKLTVEGAGSWPLPLSAAAPRVGEKVFAINPTAEGSVAIAEGTVSRVRDDPRGRVIEATMPVTPASAGGPLIDATGRVLGVAAATEPDGALRHLALPPGWLAAKAPPHKEAPRNVEAAGDAAPAKPAEPGTPPAKPVPAPKTPVDFSPERKEELRKAFRPDPNVPPDL